MFDGFGGQKGDLGEGRRLGRRMAANRLLEVGSRIRLKKSWQSFARRRPALLGQYATSEQIRIPR